MTIIDPRQWSGILCFFSVPCALVPAKVDRSKMKEAESMEIRKAQLCDLDGIMEVIHDAQCEMHREGIPQWINGYPDEKQIHDDIACNSSYVVVKDERRGSHRRHLLHEGGGGSILWKDCG